MERFLNEGPTLLQLHKWEPSQLQLKISEFCEAFISPSRQLLALLSYHSEALLLSLVAGTENGDGNHATNEQMAVSSTTLPLVTVPAPTYSKENGVIWGSSANEK